jgi:putative heme-binding domain-containing protein
VQILLILLTVVGFASVVPRSEAVRTTPIKQVSTRPAIEVSGRESAVRGRNLFVSGPLECRNCHSIQPGESSFGPNLSGVGRRLTREQIESSILEPSKDIAPGFGEIKLLTNSGRVITGTVQSESTDTLVLEESAGKIETVARNEIEEQQNGISPMPEGLTRNLTKQQFADLVEFLVGMRADMGRK